MIEHYLFADGGNVPSNPRLPLIVYWGALERSIFAPSLSQQRT
jgi:uncharacterized protein YjlB